MGLWGCSQATTAACCRATLIVVATCAGMDIYAYLLHLLHIYNIFAEYVLCDFHHSIHFNSYIHLVPLLYTYTLFTSPYSGKGQCLTMAAAALVAYNSKKVLAGYAYTTPWDA